MPCPTGGQSILLGVGAIMPEVLQAADELEASGVAAGVVCILSPDLLFRDLQARSFTRSGATGPEILARLLPAERRCPLVTVLDGHPHTLAFLAGVRGDPIACLGVSSFGQSGTLADSYALHGIDAAALSAAAHALLR